MLKKAFNLVISSQHVSMSLFDNNQIYNDWEKYITIESNCAVILSEMHKDLCLLWFNVIIYVCTWA